MPHRSVAVLVCGVPPPRVLEEGAGDYGRQFSQLLQRGSVAEEDWRFWNVYQGQLPSEEELAEFDAIVFTGGGGDAFSDEPWVVRARELVKGAHLRKQRMLGVCFGHQLIAQALGGKVGRAPQWGIGATEIRFQPEAAQQLATSQLPQQAVINVIHQDQVHELPEGAHPLASSPDCPIAMYKIGEHVLCLQGHPEFNRATVEACVDAHMARHTMTAQDETALQDSYRQRDSVEDFELIQQICTGHLRKGG